MNFKINSGTKEIGGSCVEVWTDYGQDCRWFGHAPG
jgi:hypothetical protein